MTLNLIKKYPELLDIGSLSEQQRKASLLGIFKRDIENNPDFKFRSKTIRPIKKEGEAPMLTLLHHLTTREEKDEKGKRTGKRLFEFERSRRLHWIKHHTNELRVTNVDVFSYQDRIDGKNVIRTYIYNMEEEYVVILEPYRTCTDYYLITAYHLNEPGGKNQIQNKQKKKLPEIH